ncbi:MAG: hypothetical protein ABR514_05370 [Chthoniobacterales bacterium]
MFGVTTSDDHRPVAWVGRYPVRVTSIVCALFVVGMFVTVIAQTAGWDIALLAFQTHSFLHGAIWQPLTCTLIQTASFFFLFNVFFFYWSGNQVEQYLGVRRYLKLLGLLLLVPPVVFMAWGRMGALWSYYGSYELTIGMFIAFATLYPNVEIFGWVSLKWLAFAGLVLGSMQYLPRHDWGYLTVLWGMCLTAFVFIRVVQERLVLPASLRPRNPFRKKPRLRVVQKSETARRASDTEDVYASVDPILDKISKFGIGSLTPAERRQLDRARDQLLNKTD